MNKIFNKSNKATIAGYIAAIFNAAILIEWDSLNWSLTSTYVKVIIGLLGPIFMGHATQIKSTNINER